MENFENIFYMKKLSRIGGCESFFYYLSQVANNFVVFYKEGDPDQVKRLSQNVEVRKYYGQPLKCKNIYTLYNPDIMDTTEAEEYITMIHYDPMNVHFPVVIHPKTTKIIAVTKLVQTNLEKKIGAKSEVVYNPVPIKKLKVKKKTDKIHIISCTRLTSEKGGWRIDKLSEMLDKAKVNYEWTVYTNKNAHFRSPNVIRKDINLDLRKEVAEATYLAQLSDCEADGLSPAEALLLGTPVIVTDLPVYKELGYKHGENCIIVDLSLKNVDIDLIKKGIPPFTYKRPKSKWKEILGTSDKYNPNELIPVEILKPRFYDVVLNKHFKRGRTYEGKPILMTKARVSELEAKEWVKRI